MHKRLGATGIALCFLNLVSVELANAGKRPSTTQFSAGIQIPSRFRSRLPEGYQPYIHGREVWQVVGAHGLSMVDNHLRQGSRVTRLMRILTKGLHTHIGWLRDQAHFGLVSEDRPTLLNLYRFRTDQGTLGDDDFFVDHITQDGKFAGAKIGSIEVGDGTVITTFDHAVPLSCENVTLSGPVDEIDPSHVVAYHLQVSKKPNGIERTKFSLQLPVTFRRGVEEPTMVTRILDETYDSRRKTTSGRYVEAMREPDGRFLPCAAWPVGVEPAWTFRK